MVRYKVLCQSKPVPKATMDYWLRAVDEARQELTGEGQPAYEDESAPS